MRSLTLIPRSATLLNKRIDEYFIYIGGERRRAPRGVSALKEKTEHKLWAREPEPATVSGMALFLGFTSKHEFELYEQSGKHAGILKRGRLRIEAAYEARLHQTPTGVIFALKTMGWNDKPEVRKPATDADDKLKVEIINTGPLPAGSEKEVSL